MENAVEKVSDYELRRQIAEINLRIAELRLKLHNNSKQRFHHKCPQCSGEWDGYKENVKECIYCKRLLVDVKVDPLHLRYEPQIDLETKKYTGRFINERHGWAWEWVVDPESRTKSKVHFKLGEGGPQK